MNKLFICNLKNIVMSASIKYSIIASHSATSFYRQKKKGTETGLKSKTAIF